MIERLVLASNNEGKLREFRRLLSVHRIEVVAQAELGIPEGADQRRIVRPLLLADAVELEGVAG